MAVALSCPAMALSLDPRGLLDPLELSPSAEEAAFARLRAARERHLGAVPDWRGLGHRRDLLSACRSRVEEIRGTTAPDTLLVLGIGGSALGTRALLDALAPLHQECGIGGGNCRVLVLDNVDPDGIAPLLAALEPAATHVAVVSKSGGTLEVRAQFLVVWRWLREALGADEARARCTFVTDPERGLLRGLAETEGFAALPVPPGVGGRYSVLTPVGLFPALMAGLDAESLLAGAADCAARLAAADERHDPAGLLALAHVLHLQAGRPIHVHFVYSQRAATLGAWFVQLWAESLGKARTEQGAAVAQAPTPLEAVGATDQHSKVQLFVEGPDDKVYLFVAVAESQDDVALPAPDWDLAPLHELAGRSLSEVLRAERIGTERALREAGRPVGVLTLDRLDAEHLGRYFLLMEETTALAGRLMGVDPYDQPGVEAGKRIANRLLAEGVPAVAAADRLTC